jgi:hypothetical protein
MGLPCSILRFLAPLAEPEPWAQEAKTLQEGGERRVRSFAQRHFSAVGAKPQVGGSLVDGHIADSRPGMAVPQNGTG